MSNYDDANPAPVKIVYRKTNPYLAALATVGIVSLVLGIVFTLVDTSPSYEDATTTDWAPVVAGALFQIGVLAALLALAAGAITWHANAAEKEWRA